MKKNYVVNLPADLYLDLEDLVHLKRQKKGTRARLSEITDYFNRHEAFSVSSTFMLLFQQLCRDPNNIVRYLCHERRFGSAAMRGPVSIHDRTFKSCFNVSKFPLEERLMVLLMMHRIHFDNHVIERRIRLRIIGIIEPFVVQRERMMADAA